MAFVGARLSKGLMIRTIGGATDSGRRTSDPCPAHESDRPSHGFPASAAYVFVSTHPRISMSVVDERQV
jgi:hypothetical protein